MTVIPNIEKVKKILVTRTDRIGDLILSLPAIESIKKRFPEAELYLVALPGIGELAFNNPYIDRIIFYDKRGREKKFLDHLKFAVSLRKEKIDLAVHLHPTNRVHFISFVAGIPVRIGYERKWPFLLTHKIKDLKYRGEKHESEYNYDILSLLGIEKPEKIEPKVYLTDADVESFRKKSAVLGIEYSSLADVVTIFPGASCPSKRWGLDNFVKLISKIRDVHGLDFAIIGGKDEIEYAEYIENKLPFRVFNFSSLLTLRETGVLLRNSRLMISNDSGPAHLASAVGTPVIVIFGRNNSGLSPVRWMPIGERNRYILGESNCVVCLAHRCEKEFECLKNVKVDDLFLVVEEVLSEGG